MKVVVRNPTPRKLKDISYFAPFAMRMDAEYIYIRLKEKDQVLSLSDMQTYAMSEDAEVFAIKFDSITVSIL